MMEEVTKAHNGACLQSDVCIVGAGPAGIALALDLAARGLSVLLLESGHVDSDATTQSLYEGEVADARMHSPADKYRQRRLGGSSAIWGGRCMPMDPIDFESRNYVPHSGWPISYDELLPYYPAANSLAEAGRFSYDADDALGATSAPMIRGFESALVRTTGLERFSCPTNFGTRYQKRLELSLQIKVLLGANCVGLKLNSDGKSVGVVEIASLTGARFTVVSRITVLATGGLETARLLLASNDVSPEGVGNAHDVVGRYYMCHIAGNVGQLRLNGTSSQVQHNYEISPEGIYCRRRISIAAGEQRRRGLANSVARLHFPRITDPSHHNGVLSGLFLARKLISYEYGKRLADGKPASIGTYARHMLNVVADPLDTSAFLSHWVVRRTLAARKFPSVILRNRTNRFSLEMHGEQAPLESSRVTLSKQCDLLGMPKIRIDWRYCPSDIESLRRTLDLIAQEVEASGVGRFEYQRETLEEDLTRFGAYGGHHIGTTRMGNDQRTSVVDKDCQVHSVNNLYVAGSAVFPTSSQANPTLTLLALALRLGDKIGGRLGSRKKPVPAEASE
jgi:choline dehydrogenase-like flavoprotein